MADLERHPCENLERIPILDDEQSLEHVDAALDLLIQDSQLDTDLGKRGHFLGPVPLACLVSNNPFFDEPNAVSQQIPLANESDNTDEDGRHCNPVRCVYRGHILSSLTFITWQSLTAV